MKMLATTVNDTITVGLKDISTSWQTNSEINRENLALKDQQVQALASRMEVLEKTAGNYKQLADQSLLDRDGLRRQINDIMAAREKTADENNQKISAIQEALSKANHQIDELTKKLESKDTDLINAQAEFSAIKLQYDLVIAERGTLNTELEKLKKRVEYLESQMDKSMATIADLEKSNEQLKAERDQLRADNERLAQDNQLLRDKLKSMEQPPTNSFGFKSTTIDANLSNVTPEAKPWTLSHH